MSHTPQAHLVKEAVVHEVSRDVYALRRAKATARSPELALARMLVLVEESIVELYMVRREVKMMIEHAKETG